jgi:hypothetical protein
MTCSVDGCEKPTRTRGWCIAHYGRWLRTGTLELSTIQNKGKICSITECDSPAKYRGWCKKHYERWKKHGDPTICLKEWKGGRIKNGYQLIRTDDLDYIQEHRLVMEKIVGRKLLPFPQETVHHVNGNTLDNNATNLELWASSHPAGQRVNDLRAWAIEILERYPEDVNVKER